MYSDRKQFDFGLHREKRNLLPARCRLFSVPHGSGFRWTRAYVAIEQRLFATFRRWKRREIEEQWEKLIKISCTQNVKGVRNIIQFRGCLCRLLIISICVTTQLYFCFIHYKLFVILFAYSWVDTKNFSIKFIVVKYIYNNP